MAFSDALTNDLATFYNTDEFAVTVTYDGTSITADVMYGDSGKDRDYNKDFSVTKAVLRVKQSDVTNPAYRDTVIIGSNTWYVQREIQGDGYDWVIGIERAERPELV